MGNKPNAPPTRRDLGQIRAGGSIYVRVDLNRKIAVSAHSRIDFDRGIMTFTNKDEKTESISFSSFDGLRFKDLIRAGTLRFNEIIGDAG